MGPHAQSALGGAVIAAGICILGGLSTGPALIFAGVVIWLSAFLRAGRGGD